MWEEVSWSGPCQCSLAIKGAWSCSRAAPARCLLKYIIFDIYTSKSRLTNLNNRAVLSPLIKNILILLLKIFLLDQFMSIHSRDLIDVLVGCTNFQPPNNTCNTKIRPKSTNTLAPSHPRRLHRNLFSHRWRPALALAQRWRANQWHCSLSLSWLSSCASHLSCSRIPPKVKELHSLTNKSCCCSYYRYWCSSQVIFLVTWSREWEHCIAPLQML